MIVAAPFLSARTGAAADVAATQPDVSAQAVDVSWPRVFEKDDRNRVAQRDSMPLQQRSPYGPSYRSQSRDSMDFQSQARSRGVEQTQRSNQFRSAASSGGGVRTGGGRR